MSDDVLWPRYADPADLAAIEAVPLEARGLPETTYALLASAAEQWPEKLAVTVLPDAARWRDPLRRTFADLLADVHRYANLLYQFGVRLAQRATDAGIPVRLTEADGTLPCLPAAPGARSPHRNRLHRARGRRAGPYPLRLSCPFLL